MVALGRRPCAHISSPLVARQFSNRGLLSSKLSVLKPIPQARLSVVFRRKAVWAGSLQHLRPKPVWAGSLQHLSSLPGGDERPRRGMFSRVLGAGAVVSMLFGKVKYVLLALKLTKMAPLLSMVASSAAYSLVYGPMYGCGMVGLILFHECGHAIAMNHYGVPFSPMVFVPFMGAAIQVEKHPRSATEEVVIALAGPVVGSAAAVACAGAGHAVDSQLLMALGDWGLMINLFNLLPIGSLDGGRVADALSPALPPLGLLGGCGLVYYGVVANPIFYLILIMGGLQVGSRVLGIDEPKPWKRLHGPKMWIAASAYAGLVASLIVAMGLNNYGRKSPNQLRAERDLGVTDTIPADSHQTMCYDDYFATFDDNSSKTKDDPPTWWA